MCFGGRSRVASYVSTSRMKLYYYPDTRAQAVRWMLEELGVQYDLVHLDLLKGEQKSQQYLTINPMGAVPAIECNDYSMFEGVAIVLKLADQFPAMKLAPAESSPDRAAYLQWCLFGIANLDIHLGYITLHRELLPEDQRLPLVAEVAEKSIVAPAICLDSHLSENAHMLGDKFSAADILICHYANWLFSLGIMGDYSNLNAYRLRLIEREAYLRSIVRDSASSASP